MKQAARAWNQEVDTQLRILGFLPSNADPCIYINTQQSCFLGVYVDDIIIAAPGQFLNKHKNALQEIWDMTDLGELKYCLRLEVERDRFRRTIILHQHAYASSLLDRLNMSHCKPMPTPQDPKIRFSKTTQPISDLQRSEMQRIPYRQATGSLLHLACSTRPDIAAAVGVACRFNDNPCPQHWNAVNRILRYVKDTISLGLLLGGTQPTVLRGYADADCAGDIDTRNSNTGYLFQLNPQYSPITWPSKLQPTTALSSCEAEYLALSAAIREAIWLRRLLSDLHQCQNSPTTIFEDNQGAIELTKNNKHQAYRYSSPLHSFPY